MNLLGILSAPVTLLAMIVTIAVSVAGFNNPRLVDAALLDMHAITRRREYYRLATSAFVHSDPLHLFMNMLALFFFGPVLEARLIGSAGFALVYVACLIAGSAWAVLEHHKDASYRALGASGAVSGVTVVFALFEPLAQIIVFVLPVPAILFAAFYIGWSAFAIGRVHDGVGHAAHLGGALMGVVITTLLWPDAIEGLIDQVRSVLPGA